MQEAPVQPARGNASRGWQRVWLWPSLVIVLVVGLDQATKHLILNNLHRLPIYVIDGFFTIVYVKNPGAAWGIFAKHTNLLAILSGVVFVLVAIFYRRFTLDWTERCVAISLMLGGIFGNFIDRAFYSGVIDFLSFMLGSYEWPAFNVADAAICIGVGLFLISSFLRPEHHPVPQPQVAQDAHAKQ